MEKNMKVFLFGIPILKSFSKDFNIRSAYLHYLKHLLNSPGDNTEVFLRLWSNVESTNCVCFTRALKCFFV